jgi:hypothetical protein
LASWGISWPPPKGWRAELIQRWHDQQDQDVRELLY